MRSVSLAFSILRALAEARGDMSLSEVARMLGVSPSTCLAVLRTLLNEGVLELHPRKRYALAEGWDKVGGLLESPDARLLDRCQPILARIAATHDATLGLWRTNARQRVELVRLAESTSPTRIHMAIGQRQPLGAGSIGRALAAAEGISEADIRQRFALLRWKQPISIEAYLKQVALAAKSGFAVDDGFAFAGVCSVAVVVPGSPTRYCLSASTFAGSRDVDAMRNLGEALKDLARDIGRVLARAPAAAAL